MRRSGAWIAIAMLGLGALALAACSSETRVAVDQQQQTGIAVSGTGRVTVVPDIALVNLGVEVTRSSVADARSAAATAMDAVRASLKRSGVDDKDVATSYFSIQPQYGSSEPLDKSGTPRITGYTVVNQLAVKVRRIDDLSKVVDSAVAAGGDATRVQNIAFTVDQPAQFEADARQKAVDDAHARAEQLAKLAGVNLGHARAVSESTAGVAATDLKLAVPATGAGSTPFSPGQTEVSLTVNVVYDIE
ncbi:MAG: SIMPL domain-containing protein [Dehalococcoidia bacterium]